MKYREECSCGAVYEVEAWAVHFPDDVGDGAVRWRLEHRHENQTEGECPESINENVSGAVCDG